MSSELPPEVEAALLAIARRAYPIPKGQATSIGSAALEDLREAYRLGLAAGREDGELLDWLIENASENPDDEMEDVWLAVGDGIKWPEGVRAAIRAAKGAK